MEKNLNRWRFRMAATALWMALWPMASWAGKDFAMPKPREANSYVAHDQHPDEKVTVGLETYDTPDKASLFSVHYAEIGVLPVFVVVTNESDQPVALTDMKVELVTADRAKLSPMLAEDIYRRLSHPHPHTSTYPLPIPRKPTGGVKQKTQDEIQNSRFDAKAVEPHSSQAGFFFFDISDLPNPEAGSHLYLTGVRDAKGDELMYFDVGLQKD